jgi:flagellar motor switch protein FliN/FliY
MSERLRQFSEKWLEVVAAIFRQLTGATVEAELREEAPLAGVHAVTVQFRADPRRRMTIQFGPESYRQMAKALLGQEVGADDGDAADAVQEFWRQVAGRANTELTKELGGAQLELAAEATMPPPGTAGWVARLNGEPGLELGWSYSGFLPAEPESPVAEPDTPAAGAANRDENLNLLMDVPLPVTLRFGGRRMPLRKIMELSSGAVIELDRQTEEPVELCLEDRVIARGQVVMVDGCYGLRVTQVCRRVEENAACGAQE